MSRKGRGTGPRGGRLSEEDRALWESVTREAKPLRKKAPSAPEALPATPAETPSETPPGMAARRVAKRVLPRAPGSRSPPAQPAPAIGRGDIAGVDKRTAERMRRGRMAVDATLDLHGHTQAQAQRELVAFLAGAQAAGKRCVLIVTGKGVGTEGGGVLRAQVPRWLNEPENRPRVLAFDYAQPQHGGMGALYVLLRRKRP